MSGTAHAQDPEAAALFSAAKDLASKGQWTEACPRFEAAQRKEPTLGILMNLADCHEHATLIFRSWGEWRLAYEQAKKAGDDARADLAKRRFEGIAPRLPQLKVMVSGVQADLSVWRDDKQLDYAEYNIELPIDPGTRTVTVRRGTATLATKSAEMKEKAHDAVSFDLDAIAKEHPVPATPRTSTPTFVYQVAARPPKGPRNDVTLYTAGLVTTAVGAVVLAGGGVTVGVSLASQNGNGCAGCVIGGVLLLTGVIAIPTGIIMAAVGGTRLTPAEVEERRRSAWWVPRAVGVSLRAVTLDWTF